MVFSDLKLFGLKLFVLFPDFFGAYKNLFLSLEICELKSIKIWNKSEQFGFILKFWNK
jgi:hypothetical protein